MRTLVAILAVLLLAAGCGSAHTRVVATTTTQDTFLRNWVNQQTEKDNAKIIAEVEARCTNVWWANWDDSVRGNALKGTITKDGKTAAFPTGGNGSWLWASQCV